MRGRLISSWAGRCRLNDDECECELSSFRVEDSTRRMFSSTSTSPRLRAIGEKATSPDDTWETAEGGVVSASGVTVFVGEEASSARMACVLVVESVIAVSGFRSMSG